MQGVDHLKRLCAVSGALLLLTCASARFTRSEQLPLRLYTTADGLARDVINRIRRDSHGFLWFATQEGLSRFDGYEFTNYTTDQGMPPGEANDILETRAGQLWFATRDGLVKFNPRGSPQSKAETPGNPSSSARDSESEPMFARYYPADERSAHYTTVLLEDGDGTIWCGTANGIYAMKLNNGEPRFEAINFGMPQPPGDGKLVEAIAEDKQGNVWVGTGTALYRRTPDGQVNKFGREAGLPDTFINALCVDRAGRIWVGTRYNGLAELTDNIRPGRSIVARVFSPNDGLGSKWIASLFQDSKNTLWVGTNTGLSKGVAGETGEIEKFVSYTTANGLSDAEVWAIAEDEGGSLWLGTANGGAMKFSTNGFTTYDERDGLGQSHITSIFADQTGAVCAMSALQTGKSINRFDGKRFISAWPRSIRPGGWGWGQISFQDREGDWWIESAGGVARFSSGKLFEQLSNAQPKQTYRNKEDLKTDDVFRLFEDAHGDVWISGMGTEASRVTRWERATETLHLYGNVEGLRDVPTAFREDTANNLWIGTYAGLLFRYANGTFQDFSESENKPSGLIHTIFLDSRKRLWIASSRGGVSRVDNPTEAHPRFVTYTTRDGLSSNEVWAVTEDRWGRIYLGTGRALDQLDPDSGHVKHYTSADGLARGKVEEAFRDRNGDLWFGTAEGLSRFVPQPDETRLAPPVLISGLRIAGTSQRVSALGETSISNLELDPQQKDLQIDFVGLGFAPGEVLRYQYKLEGADKDWSLPTTQRRVSYANLSPGRYRFMVRAMNATGLTTQTPAVITFRILPPIWQRWWFLALAIAAIALAAYQVHKYRLAQALKLERVRTRIATDLHDDIGSSLSQVSVLSEVISRRVKNDPAVAEPLSTIGNVSRDLVDSLNDIVWAINPRRDHLTDLVQRMRRFASDVFTAREIDFIFSAPETHPDFKLGADMRRDVFLIFKESVNNIVKHSHCSRADIKFSVSDGMLELAIVDNGCGFNGTRNCEGNGLLSMQHRAAGLGATFEINSNKGSGTKIVLRVPMAQSRLGWNVFNSN